MDDDSQNSIYRAIINRLENVIDPETNVDVVRMRLVENICVDEDGRVSYIFRPSSPICPIAVFLAIQIKKAVSEVQGITSQNIKIEGYLAAEELTQIINQEI